MLAADMRRKKPRQVPRPGYVSAAGAGGASNVTSMDAYKRAVGVLAATSRGVRR